MKFHFFGGANEVGASSMLIEIDGYHILVDAGIRMGPGQDSQLPDFPDFEAIGMPDAVLLTHAHTDHTGALPVLRDLWLAGVKIYYTPTTKAITRVLLEDSADRAEDEEQEEDKPPLYTRDDVEVALHCMEKEVQWRKPLPICGNVTATWISAGHILGAAMVYIKGREASILITGDVSAANQLTLPGMAEKLPDQPDVMVMESTYGNRRHGVDRPQEAKRLAEDVAKVVIGGGKVLIPAFAVGRSQEVILILKNAMEREQIPPFPIHVDGMVRKINKIYSDFADELSPSLQRKIERGENLFYSDSIRQVTSRGKSDSILNGPPCCIVASSGMLIGGMSTYYAKVLASDPNNLIAITGYQAEGTPGRALLDLTKADEPIDQTWKLNDGTLVNIKCQVERYSLSAHADSDELLALIQRVQPRKLFLVHGDDRAREKLAESVYEDSPAIDVELPENGETYGVKKRKGISRGRQLANDRILSEVAAFVRKMGHQGPFRVRELAEIWFGTDRITPLVIEFFELCLWLETRFFERGSDDLLYLR